MNIKCFCFNAFQECCSVVWDESGECMIVDPGFYDAYEKGELFGFISDKGLDPVRILLTHAHFDHIFGVAETAKHYGIPVYMSAKDKVIVENNKFFCNTFGLKTPDGNFDTVDINGGDIITFGNGHAFEVIETPGHTPGGVCYLCRDSKVLFSGDTLFAGAIGRTDNQWGDYDALMKGIFEGLMVLDGDIRVIPGHGPQTTIADERMKNPFLMPFNEPIDE